MGDVSCIVCAPLVAEVRARGLAPEPLVDGLALEVAQLENPRGRIPWDAFTVFARRASEVLGGADQVEQVAARSAAESVPRVIRKLLPRLGSAKPIYLLGARWWGPWVFRGTRATCEELADGRLREVIEILPEYRACPEFFQGLRGVLRAMPGLFGQPEAVVEMRQDGRRGEFVISAPPARRHRTLRWHRRSAVSATLEELEELGFRQEQLRESMNLTRAVTGRLANKSRRLETLGTLGRELARHRDPRVLAEAVVGLLAERLRVRGIRLSRCEGETLFPLAENGETGGPPTETLALEAAGRSVGTLALWGLVGEDSADDAALLCEVTPWLGVALANARASEEVAQLTRLVEDEIDDWRRVEECLKQVLEGDSLRQLQEAEEPDPQRTAFGASETVLLVEMDDASRRMGRRLLEAHGHRVLEAASAPEALAICERKSDPIDLLVTDASAPSFGPDAARDAMKLRPELRAVVMLRLRQH